ncbi:MAG: hypothetical protein M1829_004151 [Trizodia sp. TS-e1964]|nr:MAG: hypothetical protein M1829_004151 [Trizodia sp. TS-e1964]
MVQQSPPPSSSPNEADLHSGLELIALHNATTRYPSEPLRALGEENAIQLQGNQHVSMPYQSYQRDFSYSNGGTQPYPGYDSNAYYLSPQNGYNMGPPQDTTEHGNNEHRLLADSTPNSNIRRTRSGRPIGDRTEVPDTPTERRAGKGRVPKAPSKSKRNKGDKPKTDRLSGPLSEVTDQFHHIPIRDMEVWVNRSMETRRKEVEKRNGYVTRPMNSFMLYRSAYSDRTKVWCLQNNHQVVSSVSGESWPMEPPEIREKYNEYAKIERENHQKAHPGYKFSPSKSTSSAAKKRKQMEEEEMSEPSELDDLDYEYTRRTPKSRKQKKDAAERGNSQFQTNRSSYLMTNPGRALPKAIAASNHGEYYQTTVYANGTRPGTEDLKMRTAQIPRGLEDYQHHSYIRRSGSPEILYHVHPAQLLEAERVDPALLAYDSNQAQYGNHGSWYPGSTVEHHPDPGFNSLYRDDLEKESIERLFAAPNGQEYQNLPAFHPNMAVLTESVGGQWQVEGDNGPLDTGSEFDKWMEDHNAGD